MPQRNLTFLLSLVLMAFAAARAQPVANFSANKTSGCSPLTVMFTDLSGGNPTSFEWDLGNGNNSILQNPSAIYAVPGTYHVTLKVSNSAGSHSVTRTAYITVFSNPVANFTFSTSGGCAPLAVQFTSTSTPGTLPISSYLWDFGDGTILNGPANVSHTYTASAQRTLSLTVKDANGCEHTVTKNNAINISQAHTVSFTGSPLFSCTAPLTSDFKSNVSPAGNYTYLWSSSNGQTFTTPDASFTFSTPGEYDVSLRVSDPSGCTETVTKTKHVVIANPVADYVITGGAACHGDLIALTNKTTPNNTTTTYKWTIGSISSTTRDFSARFNSGTYAVTLEASDRGCKSTKTGSFTVHPKPRAGFSAQPSVFCKVPATVDFNANPAPANSSLLWDFGNGQTSSIPNPSTTYTGKGRFKVRLTVISPEGCRDSAVQEVYFRDAAGEISGRNMKAGCAPLKTLFEFRENPGHVFSSFEWRYNNQVLSTAKTFDHTFNDTGIYVITLRALTPEGCEVLLTDTVKVGMPFTPDFTSDKRADCYGKINPVKFTASSDAGNLKGVRYFWQLTSGTKQLVGEGKEFSQYFSDTGLYTVKLVIDHNGCKKITEKPDYIFVLPAIARFDYPLIECGSDTVRFNNLSIGQNRYLWLFGDGDSSTLRSPKHKYLAPGAYTITLVATDTVTGCSDTARRSINVPRPPRLSFSLSDTIGCSPLKVKLTNTTVLGSSDYPIVSTYWLFSTRGISQLASPTLEFTTQGYTQVTMVVRDSRNCEYAITRDSAIHVIKGLARMSVQNDAGCAPLTSQFRDNSVTEFPIVKRTWKWSLTDSTVTTLNPVIPKTFDEPGKPQHAGVPVTLVVTDSFGCRFSETKAVFPSRPLSAISVARSFRCGEQDLQYSTPNDANSVFTPASFRWTLHNQVKTNAAFILSYSQPDTTFGVSLKVTDALGCEASSDSTLNVLNKKPLAGFYANPKQLECYKPVIPISLFDTTVRGTTPIRSWSWKAGPNVSDRQNPGFTFPEPGKYGVSLVIEDSAGCRDSASIPDYIIIGGPLGGFNFSPVTGCMPHEVGFTAFSPNGKYYKWDMGDGHVDSGQTTVFTYTYPRAGRYIPRLTIKDSSGTCEREFMADTITVHALPKPEFDADKYVVCIRSEITFVNKTPDHGKVRSWLWIVDGKDSLPFKDPAPWLFTQPGSYKVSLVAVDTNNCTGLLEKEGLITVIDDTIPPAAPNALTASVTDNESAVFSLTRSSEPDFSHYLVRYNYFSGSPVNYTRKEISDTIFIQGSINTLANPYSYSVAAADVCNNISDNSEVHTTVEVKARSLDNAIEVSWTPYAGFDTINRYEIWRNNPDSSRQFVLIGQVPPDSLHFSDTATTCFTTYFYQVKTVEQGGDEQVSWSDTAGAVPVYVPTMPPTRNIRVTVVNDSYILLQWEQRRHKVPFSYVLYRMRDDESSPVAYRELSDTFFIDTDVDVDGHSYSYFTYLKDVCGGLSPASNEARSILLKVNLKENDLLKYDPIIDFIPYRYWSAGVLKYEADFYYDSAGAFSRVTTLEPNDTQFFHRYVNLQQRDYCYKVTAFEDTVNGTFSESNISCIDTKPRLYAPNVFTINGDGLNDRFELGGVFLDTYHLIIYNRWGQLVFESTDINHSWDGTIEGKPAPADVYVYLAEGTGRRNQRISIKGNVTLLR